MITRETKPRVSRTKLKFVESDKTGEMVAYVTIDTSNGHILGVNREANVPKKIVLISKQIASAIVVEHKVLYDVEIVPMGKGENNKSCKGFIVTSITPTQFDTTVELGKRYAVCATFGNQTIVFDPQSRKQSRNNLDTVINLLEARGDINNKSLVITEFKEKANESLKRYEDSYPDLLKKLESKYEAA